MIMEVSRVAMVLEKNFGFEDVAFEKCGGVYRLTATRKGQIYIRAGSLETLLETLVDEAARADEAEARAAPAPAPKQPKTKAKAKLDAELAE